VKDVCYDIIVVKAVIEASNATGFTKRFNIIAMSAAAFSVSVKLESLK